MSVPRVCGQHDDVIAQERDDAHPAFVSGCRGATNLRQFSRCGVSEETARKWRRRDSVQDLSATPHRLQITLTAAQDVVVVDLDTPLRQGQGVFPMASNFDAVLHELRNHTVTV